VRHGITFREHLDVRHYVCYRGRVTVKTVFPGFDVNDTFPPWALTMVSTMERPSPVLPELLALDESPLAKR
jgi:hypothetical protein